MTGAVEVDHIYNSVATIGHVRLSCTDGNLLENECYLLRLIGSDKGKIDINTSEFSKMNVFV